MSAWQIGRTEICRCGKFCLKTTGRAQWLTQWVGPWIWWAMEVLDIVSVHGVHASNIFKLCQSYAEVSPSEERAASWNRDVTAIISNYFKDLSPVWLAGLELDFESRWFRIKNQNAGIHSSYESTQALALQRFLTMFEKHLQIRILALLVLVSEVQYA